jgi:calcium-dependent protein kinase
MDPGGGQEGNMIMMIFKALTSLCKPSKKKQNFKA